MTRFQLVELMVTGNSNQFLHSKVTVQMMELTNLKPQSLTTQRATITTKLTRTAKEIVGILLKNLFKWVLGMVTPELVSIFHKTLSMSI